MYDRYSHLHYGNLNAHVLAVCQNYAGLYGDRKETMSELAEWLQQFGPMISPAARAALLALPQAHRDHFGIRISLTAPPPPASQPIGCLDFPAVSANLGAVRRIRVTENGRSDWSTRRREQLDRVGAAVLNAVWEKDRIICRNWDPERWRFDTLKLNNCEDNIVQGESMDLALAIALYSRLVDKPAPIDVSASARVDRQGRIWPIEGLAIKLATLRRERHWLTRVIVSADQQSPPRHAARPDAGAPNRSGGCADGSISGCATRLGPDRCGCRS